VFVSSRNHEGHEDTKSDRTIDAEPGEHAEPFDAAPLRGVTGTSSVGPQLD